MSVVRAVWIRAVSCCAAVLTLLLTAAPGHAEPLKYPPASATAADAAAGFDDRARAVVAFNACGREAEYATIRAEFAAGNFDHQGEDMGSILIAKAAFVRASPAGTTTPTGHTAGCVGRLDRAAVHAVTDCVQVIGLTDQPDAPAFDVVVTPACMVRQINEAVLAMKKNQGARLV